MTIELPDVNLMFEVIDKIYELSLRKAKIDLKLKIKESEITKEAQSNENYFQNGKPPSQTFVDNAFKFAGFKGELLEDRMELLIVDSELDFQKRRLEMYKLIIDIWRTESANERVAVT